MKSMKKQYTSKEDLEKQPLRDGKMEKKLPRYVSDDNSINNMKKNETSKKSKNTSIGDATAAAAFTQTPYYPRLIPRDLPFEQSRNTIKIHNRERGSIPIFPSAIRFILSYNWFHILLRWNTMASVSLLVGFWLMGVTIFAQIYKLLDEHNPHLQCGLGKPGQPIDLSGAFAFSLETCTTVGYGLPNDTNNFFDPECRYIQIAITLQMISSMLFNAFLTAFLWCRLARCDQRSAQVLFANKAIIERRDGKWLFHVRMYDVDSSLPIVEAHVRFYCVSWVDYDNQVKRMEQPQLMRPMRILHPDDDLGSVLFTSVPFNVTHHIDFYSPLASEGSKDGLNYMRGHGLNLREVDQMSGSNAACCCPVCGETYETFENLERHIAFNKVMEDADPSYPIAGTHRDTDILKPILTRKFDITKEDIQENLRGKEILCVVEGIEPMVSGTFQALHSYKVEDIAFDSCFAPCVSQIKNKAVVDLDSFHQVVPVKATGSQLSVLETRSMSSGSTLESTRRALF
eukprot:CAMPEP_0203663096 /NCGR_PEP_ID=MMETSP0090-20130426/819_1 /ASSEMBLY_ACC=CAM_ASM_001088 /TAXON_ID=426623 /ORGANISM="Chaetoceros affinis, Strain CCMP159" /LENGTH=512 /DNA_ID=CAMNT_0050525963 /DNA_START=60 /DNA_END=1598 /DNA_ORIENTATION=-